MRQRALLIEAKEALEEAQAAAIAGIGLRGNRAREAMRDARRQIREARWDQILAWARKSEQRMPTMAEMESSVTMEEHGSTE
jgi:hypothetical protein